MNNLKRSDFTTLYTRKQSTGKHDFLAVNLEGPNSGVCSNEKFGRKGTWEKLSDESFYIKCQKRRIKELVQQRSQALGLYVLRPLMNKYPICEFEIGSILPIEYLSLLYKKHSIPVEYLKVILEDHSVLIDDHWDSEIYDALLFALISKFEF